jgi:hypothetical protein
MIRTLIQSMGSEADSEASGTEQSTSGPNMTRRTAIGSVIAGAVFAGLTSSSTASPGRGPGGAKEDGNAGGFPPRGITEYGRAVSLGNGEVRPFTTVTGSGAPRYHGVEFDRAALEGLPSPDSLAAADNRAETDKYRAGGQAATVHFKESLQFFVPFPSAAETPFTFLGLNWNPEGHFGGKGAWLKPHFDVHFHMLDPATVDAVEGPRLPPYDTDNGEYTPGSPAPDPDGKVTETNFDYDQLPEGYARSPQPVADQRYITDMGEHTAPADAPELPDAPGEPGDPAAFDNTLIQGFVGDTDGSRLAFVEPMVTREFLRDFDGTQKYDVPQPTVYPHEEQHPTEYSVRDVPSKDAVTVVLGGFEPV